MKRSHLAMLMIVGSIVFYVGAGLAVRYGDLLRQFFTGWIDVIRSRFSDAASRRTALSSILIGFMVLCGAVHLFMRWRSVRSIDASSARRPWRFRLSLAVVGLAAALLGAGLATDGIWHESAHVNEAMKVRDPHFQSESRVLPYAKNNLKLLGLSTREHDSIHGSLPVGSTYDPNGRALHGWHTALLPFVEYGNIYRAIDQQKAWNHPDNQQHFRREVGYYLHPVVPSTRDADDFPITTYAANVHVMGGERPRKIADFGNGASQVLLIGEMAGNYRAWGYPLHLRDPKLGLNRTPDGFGGPWKAGTHFLMADSSVRSFRNGTDPEFLGLLAQPGKE